MGYSNIQDRRLPFVFRYLVDLATFRHLCWNLVGSDLRARFRRSKLGILWAIIQPLAFSLLIAAVWGSVFKSSSYWDFAIYVFSGMIVWEYFANTVSVSQDSLVNAEGYLKQTRIPFFIFQIRTPLTGMVIFVCGIIGLFGMMTGMQIAGLPKLPEFGLHLLLLPAFLVVFLLFTIPIATIMSVIGTQFRDVKHISAIAIQALFFLSPVMLERAVLDSPQLQFMKFLNPMVPLLDMFRAPLLHNELWDRVGVISVASWIGALWIIAIAVQAKAGRRLVFAL